MASGQSDSDQNALPPNGRKVDVQDNRIFYNTVVVLLNNLTETGIDNIKLKNNPFKPENPDIAYCHVFFCEWDIMSFPGWSDWPATVTSKSFSAEKCGKEWSFELVISGTEETSACHSPKEFSKRNLSVNLHRTDDLGDSIDVRFTANILNENYVTGAKDSGQFSFGPGHQSHCLFPNDKCTIHPTNNDIFISGFRMAKGLLTVKVELYIKTCCGGSI